MILSEAYTILGVSESSTQDEIKKKYRELTKKFHPDINKEADNEDKFKKINEAFQCIKNKDEHVPGVNIGFDISSIWGNMSSNPFNVRVPEIIQLDIKLTFKESVLGCKQDLKFNRRAKCHECNGLGEYNLHNGCAPCNGQGQVTINRGNTILRSVCRVCGGKRSTDKCKKCTDGTLDSEVSVNVTIPGGFVNGSQLRLQGMGNFAGSFMGVQDQFTDVICTLIIEPDAELRLEGNDVVGELTIPLIDALSGAQRSVHTVLGDKDIVIPKLSKNKDEVILPLHGVNKSGSHRVVLNVTYPDDISKIVEVLK